MLLQKVYQVPITPGLCEMTHTTTILHKTHWGKNIRTPIRIYYKINIPKHYYKPNK
jgi:hypothetical protein